MSEPQLRLIMGDPYLCEQALAEREDALRSIDPAIERHAMFADELDVSSLDMELRSCSLFALGRHFVIRRVEKSRAAKALAEVAEKPMPEGTYLTLLGGSLRATSPLVKVAKSSDAMVSLPTPKGTSLQRVARSIIQASGLSLSSGVVRTLLTECGDDLLSLQHELDKLRALGEEGGIPEDTAGALCFNHTEATVYPFYDRMGEGQLSAALVELEGLREDAGRIVGGMIRHFTRLVMVRLLLDQRCPSSEIAGKVGMQDWLCRRLIGQAKRRSFAPLVCALRKGVEMDQRIKQGRIAPDDALMQLILVASGATAAPDRPSQG
jgi:DNA polymerase III delta subunit